MELRANTNAFLDTFDGLIPCKVLKVNGSSRRPELHIKTTVRITKTVKAWKKDEQVTYPSAYVVPTAAVKVRQGFFRIAHYAVVES